MEFPKIDKKKDLLSKLSRKIQLAVKAIVVGSTVVTIGALTQPVEAKTFPTNNQTLQFQKNKIPGKLIMKKMASSENLMFGHSSHYSHSSHSSHSSHYSHYSSR